jgi:His/Glu/Gln/Arg/opine family amino acid ABC transporter permease subunit
MACTARRLGRSPGGLLLLSGNGDEPVARYYARLAPGTFAVAGRATAPEPIGVAVRKGEKALRQAVAEAVQSMKEDGTFGRISTKWFGTELGEEPPSPGTGAPDEEAGPAVATPGFWRFSGEVIVPRLAQGMVLTLQLTAGAGLCGLALGLLLALAPVSRNGLLRRVALGYVTLFRGTPLLLQVLFAYFALPPLLGVRLAARPAAQRRGALRGAAEVGGLHQRRGRRPARLRRGHGGAPTGPHPSAVEGIRPGVRKKRAFVD